MSTEWKTWQDIWGDDEFTGPIMPTLTTRCDCCGLRMGGKKQPDSPFPAICGTCADRMSVLDSLAIRQ